MVAISANINGYGFEVLTPIWKEARTEEVCQPDWIRAHDLSADAETVGAAAPAPDKLTIGHVHIAHDLHGYFGPRDKTGWISGRSFGPSMKRKHYSLIMNICGGL